MTFLAIAFLIGVTLRVFLIAGDDGFGGPVWDGIVLVSSLTWIIGVIMAIHVLTGITVEFG